MSETVIYHESYFEDGAAFEFLPTWQRQFLEKNKVEDILAIFKFDRIRAEDFMRQLTEGAGLSIEASLDNRKKLQSLYFGYANQLKAEGFSNLAIGYPFYYERTQRTLINAPLFFFPIEVSSEIAEQESYHIQAANRKYVLNYHILDYLSARYKIDFSEIKKKALTQMPFHELMESLGAQLSHELHITFNYTPNKLFPLPTLDSLAGEENDKGIFFNAVVSNSTLPYEAYKNFSFDTAKSDAKPNVFLQGISPTDVTQRQALTGNRAPIHVVAGNAGTGKTHSVLNLLSHAMSEGKKTLLVSNRLKTLLQVQEGLAKWNLEKYTFIIKDMQNDLGILLNIARAIGTTIEEKDNKVFNAKAFELATSQLRQQYNKLYTSYTTLQKDLSIADNWQSLVGMWLRANAVESREVLNVQLSSKDFSYERAEYKAISAEVQTAIPLFEKIKTLDHELSNLHPSLFENMDKNEAGAYLQEKIASFNARLSNLHREHLFAMERFRQQQRALYQVRYGNMNVLIDKIASQTEAGVKLYGQNFQTSGFWSRLLSWFSPTQREIRKLQTELKSNYEVLVKTHQSAKNFTFDFPSGTPSKPNKIAKIVKDFSSKLTIWNNGVDAQVEKEVLQLEAASSFADDNTKAIADNFTQVLADFDEAKIYAQPIERQSLSISENRKLAQQLREKLERTSSHLSEFDSYHDWQCFWLKSDSKSHKVIEGLIRSKATNWQLALDSWYFHWVLQGAYQSTMPQHTDTKEQILTHAQDLKMMLPMQIDVVGHLRRLEGLRQNRRRRLFEKDSTKAFTSFAQLFESEGATLTEFFPVLMATPDMAVQSFQKTDFDLIIFDDAQQYEAEQCANLMSRAKQVFIFGDSFNSHNKTESLLFQAMQHGEKSSNEIGIIHATRSGTMNAFLDAIYPSEALRMPILSESDFFQPIDVLGRYDEELKVNSAEAERVVMLLNEVQKLPNNRYPTVGIITTTFEQRDLIANLLLKIKQKRSVGFEKIQHLERNNFGVYHWSECTGLHFDIGIVSFTFGIKDTKAKVTKEIQYLNDDSGVESLYVLLSRASQKLYWCNSIPHSYFDEFLESSYAKGTYVLSSLIKYYQNLRKGDQQQANVLLYNVAYATGAIRKLTYNPLIEEIAEHLKAAVGEERIVFAPAIGSLTVPLMIKPVLENQPTLVLRLDGTFTLPYTPDPIWEQQFVAKLESEGNAILESWSVNWWRNPMTETTRLAEAIRAHDAAHEPKIEEEIADEITTDSLDELGIETDAQQVTDNSEDNEAGTQSTEA
jgi:hypothetical protein